MSRSLALIRFKDGQIFLGCYNGTGGFFSPNIISKKELDRKFNGDIFEFDNYIDEHTSYSDPYLNPDDSEDVTIYVLNSIFMYDATASKSHKYITSNTIMDSIPDDKIRDEVDLWVYEYYINNGLDASVFCDLSILESYVKDKRFSRPKFRIGDCIFLTKSIDELRWSYNHGMFRPSPLNKPLKKKIIGIRFTNDGVLYEVKGTYHINEKDIGTSIAETDKIAYTNFNDADKIIIRRKSAYIFV